MSEVEYNGTWYTVTGPSGNTWTFDEDEMDEVYIEEALYCWSRWLDFVKARND